MIEARVQGEGIVTFTDYDAINRRSHNAWPDYWAVEDDWHRIFMAARAGPDRLRVFFRADDEQFRTDEEQSQTQPPVWSRAGTRPILLEVATECAYSVQYFDNPGNSFINNFFKAENPDIYPHSPQVSEPGQSAILAVENCVGPKIDVSITVLDESDESAREHRITIHAVQVDWYYNPLFP